MPEWESAKRRDSPEKVDSLLQYIQQRFENRVRRAAQAAENLGPKPRCSRKLFSKGPLKTRNNKMTQSFQIVRGVVTGIPDIITAKRKTRRGFTSRNPKYTGTLIPMSHSFVLTPTTLFVKESFP